MSTDSSHKSEALSCPAIFHQQLAMGYQSKISQIRMPGHIFISSHFCRLEVQDQGPSNGQISFLLRSLPSCIWLAFSLRSYTFCLLCVCTLLVSLPFLFVCVHTYSRVCMCSVCTCVHMLSRPQVNAGWFYQSLTTLFFEAVSH